MPNFVAASMVVETKTRATNHDSESQIRTINVRDRFFRKAKTDDPQIHTNSRKELENRGALNSSPLKTTEG